MTNRHEIEALADAMEQYAIKRDSMGFVPNFSIEGKEKILQVAAALRSRTVAVREALADSGWHVTNWDRARNSGRILLVWREFSGVREHVELGWYSDSKSSWVNTYGKPFAYDPDGWAPLIPFKAALSALEAKATSINDEQIKYMVDRFLSWKLPRDTFNPDCGISFDKEPFNKHTAHPMLHEPIGTNLFDATQADAMVRYMIDGLPLSEAKAGEPVANNSVSNDGQECSKRLQVQREHTNAVEPDVLQSTREWAGIGRRDGSGVTAGETASTTAVDREAVARCMVRNDPNYCIYHMPGDEPRKFKSSGGAVLETHSLDDEQAERVRVRADAILSLLAPTAPAKEGE